MPARYMSDEKRRQLRDQLHAAAGNGDRIVDRRVSTEQPLTNDELEQAAAISTMQDAAFFQNKQSQLDHEQLLIQQRLERQRADQEAFERQLALQRAAQEANARSNGPPVLSEIQQVGTIFTTANSLLLGNSPRPKQKFGRR